MKSKVFFSLSLSALLIGAFFLFKPATTKQDRNMVIRVAFPNKQPAHMYEPTMIQLAPQYIFLENTFSALVEFSPKGELIPGIASRFEWLGNEAHFKIREGLKTIDGKPITAEDAAFSLKRLIVKTGNTHGNLKDLLCPNHTPSNTDDSCFNISTKGNTLVLSPPKKVLFLFPMLTAIDFAIIPRSSVDENTLEIVDYRNTSGVYYVSEDDGKGNIVLLPNPDHFHFNDAIPQKVVLVPIDSNIPDGSVQAFKQDQIDLITTIDAVRVERLISFAETRNDASLHTTMKIRTYTLIFSKKGRKKFSVGKRIAIGKAIRDAFKPYLAEAPGHEVATQFFPLFGEGGLKKEDVKRLEEAFSKVPMATNGRDILLTTVRVGEFQLFKGLIEKSLPGIKIEKAANGPRFIKYENENEEPDMFICGPDSGFLEDIGLISYSMNAGIFNLSKKEGQAWLKTYTEIEDKGKRLELLRELHFKTLLDGHNIPISVAPYAALVKKPWKLGLSQFFANNQLWLITKE